MKLFFLPVVAIALVGLLVSCNKETGSTAVVPPLTTTTYATLTNNIMFGPTYAPSTGSITTDPMFVNALTNDFRFKPDAPGIDKAIGTLLSTSDRRDQSRPLDGDGDGKAVGDLGALEYKP